MCLDVSRGVPLSEPQYISRDLDEKEKISIQSGKRVTRARKCQGPGLKLRLGFLVKSPIGRIKARLG